MSRNLFAKTTLAAIACLLLVGSVTQAATVLFPSGGGLGTSTPPTYGKIPVGNANGTYSLMSTSSLGIVGTGGGTGSATTTIITQTSHGFSVGQWVGLTGSTTAPYALANAVPGGIYQGVGIVASVTDSSHFVLQTGGDFTDTNLIPGMTYYLSASSTLAQGTEVGYPPTTPGFVAAPVAIAKSTTLANIQIGRPSTVAQSTSIAGINVGNDFTGSTYLSTSTMIAQATIIQKNLASNYIRIALPSWNSPVGIYNMREMSKYYKSLGYHTTYGVTGLSSFQNSTTYASWMTQIPTEAAWASANGIETFYIGNEEDWFADLGQYGTITRAQIQADVLTIATTLKVAYPNMRIVYSTAQGTVIEWHNFAFSNNFGALDSLLFNMYDTQANFEPNIQYFQSQIGQKYAVSEWGSLYDYYRMIHTVGYTDAQYAADLASRAATLKKYGIEAYFFALSFGDNTVKSGNYNILTNTGVLLPGALSAFGGGSGNQVLTTPLLLTDNQVMYFNNAHTAFVTSDITNTNFTCPTFGNRKINGRTTITSTQVPTFNIAYDSTHNSTINVSSAGLTTFDAHGSTPYFIFSSGDRVGIGTTTPDQALTVNGALDIANGNGLILNAPFGNSNFSTIAYNDATGKVNTTWPFSFDDGGVSIGSLYAATAPPTAGIIIAGNAGFGTTSPFAKLSIAGAAGGTTNLFAISTSTSAFATTTAFRISQNGNLHLMNGAGIDIGEGVSPGGNNILVQGTASTTNLTVSGLANCNTTSALTTSASGVVGCGAISGGGGAAFPFTPTTNFGALTNATGTPAWFQAGVQASSTSRFDFASTTGISAGVSAARRVFVGSDASNGIVQTFGGGLTLATDGAHTININSANTGNAQLNTGSLTTDRQFTFPDTAGTFCLTTTCTGSAFPFTPTTFGVTASNATGTLIGFTQGIYALSTSTIGDGTREGGLTVSGGATSTNLVLLPTSASLVSTRPVLFLGTSTLSSPSSGGTYIALNTPTGYGGDYINIQKAGSSVLKIDSTKKMTLGGDLSVELAILYTYQINMTGLYFHDDSPDVSGVNYFNAAPFSIGTTTPKANFQVTNGTANSTTTTETGRAVQNKGSCEKKYRYDGTAIYISYDNTNAQVISTTACASVAGF